MKLWPSWYNPWARPVASGHGLVDAAAKYLRVEPAILTGDCRQGVLVAARAAVCRLLHEKGYSYPRIGRLLGNRDHTTIQHLVKVYPHKSRFQTEYGEILLHLREVAA